MNTKPAVSMAFSYVGLMLCGAILPGSTAFAGPNTLMVGFTETSQLHRIKEETNARGGYVKGCFSRARLCILDFPALDTPILDALEDIPGVRYVERDRLMRPITASAHNRPKTGRTRHSLEAGDKKTASPPNAAYTDPEGTEDCPDLWEMSFIGMGDAWTAAEGQGAQAPVVAIEDSGFLTTHEELEGQISGTYDYGNGDPDPEVESDSGVPSHGTFIAGMLVALQSNAAGRVGVLPDGLVNLQKIADDSGALYFSYAVSAMADIAEGDLGVRVLNYSIASPSYTQSFKDAVASLEDAGILLVTAAGNCESAYCSDADNDQNPLYPGNFDYDHIVVVAGSNRDGSFNPYSHYGSSSVDLAAPSEDLCSLGIYGDDDYYTSGGTSYATPLVAGTAALLLGAYPSLSTTELARMLRASAIETPELEPLLRSGGYLSASGTLLSPMPRLNQPPDLVVAGQSVLDLDLDNGAAAGNGTLLLVHAPSFEVTDAGSWSIHPFVPGDILNLPDAGAVEATEYGTLLEGSLPEDSAMTLSLTLRGLQVERDEVSVRLIASSSSVDYLNAPYDQGEVDFTGFLALTFVVDVRSADVDQTPFPDETSPTPPREPTLTPTDPPTLTPTPTPLASPSPEDHTMTPVVESTTGPTGTPSPEATGSPSPSSPIPSSTPPSTPLGATEEPTGNPMASPTPTLDDIETPFDESTPEIGTQIPSEDTTPEEASSPRPTGTPPAAPTSTPESTPSTDDVPRPSPEASWPPAASPDPTAERSPTPVAYSPVVEEDASGRGCACASGRERREGSPPPESIALTGLVALAVCFPRNRSPRKRGKRVR